jgi:transcription elongation factor GreA
MTDLLITRDGLTRMTAELEHLTTVGRREAAERIRQARDTHANHAEDAAYQAARDDLTLLENRIALLKDRLAAAAVVDVDESDGVIDIGERVRVRDLESGDRFEVELVGPVEADPSAGRISVASPLGKALLGLRRGDVAHFLAPRGEMQFKVLAVELPEPTRRPRHVRKGQ